MTDKLAIRNPHPRDANITFEESRHIYTINGDSSYMSVTTFNHSHFEHFDADRVISGMMSSPKWEVSKYYGMTPEQIKAGWEENRQSAATLGTNLHHDIECFYNGAPNINETPEYKYFLDFVEDHKHLEPYRTEWKIYDEESKLAGSIDMVFSDVNGIHIYDWKRSKEIIKSAPFGKSAINPLIGDIPDTNFWHYCLQLNTYKYIIEKNYGLKVTDLYLVVLHPNNSHYLKIKVIDLQSHVIKLINERVQKIT